MFGDIQLCVLLDCAVCFSSCDPNFFHFAGLGKYFRPLVAIWEADRPESPIDEIHFRDSSRYSPECLIVSVALTNPGQEAAVPPPAEEKQHEHNGDSQRRKEMSEQL